MGSSDKGGVLGALGRVTAAVKDLGGEVATGSTLDKLKESVRGVSEEPDKTAVLNRVKSTLKELGDEPHTSESLDRLRTALSEFGDEVEKSARDQWETTKPELKKGVGDLQGVVDSMATKAKDRLGGKSDSSGRGES